MEIGLSTLEAECAGQGLDWEEVLEQRAREKAKLAELGLTLGENHETIKQDRLGNNARDVADDDDDSEAEQQKP
jgi:capsid protein